MEEVEDASDLRGEGERNIQKHNTHCGLRIFLLGYGDPLTISPSLNTIHTCFFHSKHLTRFPLSFSKISSRFLYSITMALTAVHVSDVPNLDQVPDKAPLCSTRFSQGLVFFFVYFLFNSHSRENSLNFDLMQGLKLEDHRSSHRNF